MNIQSTLTKPQAKLAQANSPQPKPEKTEEDSLSVQDMVTKGAYATGGALGGVGMGVVTGQVMTSLTGVPIFSQVGGFAGAVAGAGTALAASKSENKAQTLKEVFFSWGLGSAGAAGGQYAMTAVGETLAASGAGAWVGATAPLLGTVAGGLVGASLPHLGSDSMKHLKSAAATGLGASVGFTVGSFAQAVAVSNFPEISSMLAVAPVVGAVSMGAVGFNNRFNFEEYTPLNEPAHNIGKVGKYGGIGYAVGTVVGGVAHSVGGTALYTMVGPAAGLALGALGGYASTRTDVPQKELAGKATGVGVSTALATLAGDAVGHGLTALTGHQIYSQLGAAAGGLNGALVSLEGVADVDTKKAASTVFGTTAGTAAGALLGTALSALSGQEVWKVALPALGAAAGGLSALSVSFQHDKAKAQSEGE